MDSELILLPESRENYPLAGPLRNPLFGATNAAWLNPANGALIVARLDGPPAGIASALVDKAMEAETNGLWGRAYFDLRGLTNGAYKPGDDAIGVHPAGCGACEEPPPHADAAQSARRSHSLTAPIAAVSTRDFSRVSQ